MIMIAFITAREEPHLEWLCDGIEQQAQSDDKGESELDRPWIVGADM